MLTMDEALDSLGAKFCGECAAKLPVAGGQCPACGALPAVTRTELADALAEPGALAKAEAAERRAEAERLRDEMMAKLREADRVQHVSALRNARDRAQDALEDAHDRQRQADSALREAQKAEAAAAAPMREAYELHRQGGAGRGGRPQAREGPGRRDGGPRPAERGDGSPGPLSGPPAGSHRGQGNRPGPRRRRRYERAGGRGGARRGGLGLRAPRVHPAERRNGQHPRPAAHPVLPRPRPRQRDRTQSR